MKNVFYQTEKAGGGTSPQAAAPRRLLLKRLFALLFALSLGMQWAYAAYDFSATINGNTLYFSFSGGTSSNGSVGVTCPGSSVPNDPTSWPSTYTKPTGHVIIPSTVTYNNQTFTVAYISSRAFLKCDGITEITIPSTIGYIGENAFYNCTALKRVNITNLADWLMISFSSYSNPLCYGADLYCNNSKVTSLTIPSSVTSIKRYAFVSCPSLTEVTIPSHVTDVAKDAFTNCSNLTKVTINSNAVASQNYTGYMSGNAIVGSNSLIDRFGNQVKQYILGTSVTSIGNVAFQGCTGLTSVTLPDFLTSIGESAFRGCTGLTSISIPCSYLTSIGSNAFRDCSGLTKVYTNNLYKWAQIDFGNIYSNPLYYGHNLYFGDNLVTNLIITPSPTVIKPYAFYNCTSITSATIPSLVTSIGGSAFYGCTGLTSVTIPSSVTSIGGSAFYGCTAITQMTVNKTTPPSVASSNTFDGISTSIPLYVPFGCIQRYQTAQYWSRFTNIKVIPAQDPVYDAPVSIPYTQDFNSASIAGKLPAGWYSYSGNSKVENQRLKMDGSNSDVVLLPPVSSRPWIEMKYKKGLSSNNVKVEIGYVTDIYDKSTFVGVCTPQWTTSEWNTVIRQLPSLPAGARYALRNNNYSVHVDDVKLFNPNDMPTNDAMVYVEDFSQQTGTLPEGWLTFRGQAINNSGYLKIIGSEYVYLPKLTASAQKRRVMEVDVKIINTQSDTPATVDIGYQPGMNYYTVSEFVSKEQLTCPANTTIRKRLYVYIDSNQSTRRFLIKTTGDPNTIVQVDDVQVYYTYESPEQNDFICNFSTNPINTNSVPYAGAYSYLVGQPSGNLYTDHNATNTWKTGTVNGVSDKHAYCDIASSTQAVSSWLGMPFVKVTADNRLLSYDIAVTHKNGTQQPVNASQVHSSQFLKVYISEDGYTWELKKTYSGSTLANIPPTGVEKGYIRLSEYEGKTIKVAFHAGCNAGVNNNYRVHIDNVTHSIYDVYPPYNVQATNVGLTSATITCQYHLPYQSGGYVYVPRDGITPPTEIGATITEIYSNSSAYLVLQHTNAKQLEVTGLNKGKEYTVWVCSPDVEPLMWESTTFTTQNDCPTPTNLSAEVQDCMALIRWDDNGASDWEYALKKDGQYQYYEWEGQQYYEVPTYGANMVFFGDDYYNSLEPGNYSIEVRSVCDEGNYDSYGGWSESLEFTITECNFSYPAPAFSLVNIDDVDKLTLAWSDLPLPHPAASVNVTLQFHSNQSFYSGTDVVGWSDYVTDGTTIKQFTSNDYSLIDAGRTFYVRLRAFYTLPGGSGHQSEWSETITVTMPEPCAAPSNIEVEASAFSATLTWEGNADSYEVSYFPLANVNDITTFITETNSITIEGLAPRGIYRAKITGFCEYGINSETTSKQFRTTDNVIVFEDPNVEAICVNYWDRIVSDGKLSYAEAAAVTDLDEFFQRTNIQSFNELQYFTGLTEIGESTFLECEQLASITLPEGVTTIGSNAFAGCKELKSIIIPENVTTISLFAFHLSGLESIVIPANVTQLTGAFLQCPLQSITVDPDNPKYTSNGNCNVIVEKATKKLILGCANSYIYEGIVAIEDYAFFYNTEITTLELPSTLQTIGIQAFEGCSNLQSIELPANLTSIGNQAFNICRNLEEITCHATTPPTLGTDAFRKVSTDIPVYVPCGSLADYQNATGWSTFTNIQEDCNITLTITGYGNDPTTTEGWHLIASPLMYNVFPEDVENMTSNNYDLYAFDGLYEGAEWRNHKNNAVNEFNMLSSGVGYLYANSETVTLIFKGEPLSVNSYVKELDAYNTKFGHWNLIGNSFTTEATVSATDYYRIEPGTRTLMPSSGNVNPMEGIFVEYNSTLDEVEFTKLTRGERTIESPMVNIDLRNAEGRLLDRARLRMGEGNNLGKLDMLSDPNRLYFRIDGKDYAVARVNGQGEMPLNFDAAQNGTYSLNVNVEGMEMAYLHLIDNMTGEDIDLLATSTGSVAKYTFTGKPSDYASRFRLVFRATENGDDTTGTEGDSFAFIDAAGNIVITNTEAGATLQVIDVTGRVVVSTDDARNVSTNGMTAGVYVLRLINGDDVKVQKIVVD